MNKAYVYPYKIEVLFIWAIVMLIPVLTGCAGSSDPPLPIVHPDAPQFQLKQDHLDYGSLPR